MSNPLDEIKESTKSFVDDRLKNPYITAVIAVWIFTNRVLVYGIFNFSNDKNFDEKLTWISSQLNSFEKFGIKGMWVGIIWAAFWGIFSMLAFNLITTGGKVLYKWVNNFSISFLQKVDPENWISLVDFNKIYIKNQDFAKKDREQRQEIENLNEQLITLRNSAPIVDPAIKKNTPTRKKTELPEVTLTNKIIDRGYENDFKIIMESIAKKNFVADSEGVTYFINLGLINSINEYNGQHKFAYTTTGKLVKDYYAVNHY